MDITQKLKASRKDLLDLGLRNPLLNYRIKVSRIDVTDELSSELFPILVQKNKSMTFAPLPEALPDAEVDELLKSIASEEEDWNALFSQPEETQGPAARHVDTKLQTKLSQEKLHATLLKMHSAAKTSLEEKGVNTLYLALGFLTWFDTETPDTPRKAPLVLIPVDLSRASAQAKFRISYTGEEIGENLSLAEKLKIDFSIQLPSIPEDNDLDLETYFQEIDQCVKHQKNWEIDPNEITLGFFSFGKFLMYKDLADASWSDNEKPKDHPILNALLGTPFSTPEPEIKDQDKIDGFVAPDQMRQVLDADSSQTLAILDVNNGANLVIQGPPGTGKSQTITNIIAESIGLGKKVLFVAEKMAALEVVKRRLDNIGLGDAVLEIHSHKTGKKAVLEELGRTLKLGKPIVKDRQTDLSSLTGFQERLNDYCMAVNTPILDSGFNLIQAMGRYLLLGEKAPDLPQLDFSAMSHWTRAMYKERRLLVEEVQRRLAQIQTPQQNPFWGSKKTSLVPPEDQAIKANLEEGINRTHQLLARSAELSELMGFPPPLTQTALKQLFQAAAFPLDAPDLKGVLVNSTQWLSCKEELKEMIRAGENLLQIHTRYDKELIPEAWDQDLLETRGQIAAYGDKWWGFFMGGYRKAKARLAGLLKIKIPKSRDKCLELIDAVLEAKKEQLTFDAHAAMGTTLFDQRWEGIHSKWSELNTILNWLSGLYQEIQEKRQPSVLIDFLANDPDLVHLKNLTESLTGDKNAFQEILLRINNDLEMEIPFPKTETPFKEQAQQLESWAHNLESLSDLAKYNALSNRCRTKGLQTVMDKADAWPEAKEELLAAFDATWFSGLIENAFKNRKSLQQFDRTSQEYAIEKFCDLDRRLFEHNRALLALEHWKNLPHLDQGGELSIIKRELNKKRALLPIRRLMKEAGRAIQAIKPVFMMSPMSIANFLPQGRLHFDLVIFDEASQVKPVDAFGAILRADQAVVVGDSKQLPPTAFFDVFLNADAETDSFTADLESVLGLFCSQNAPERMLQWHYRSRHESLIAVSNHEFYEDRLVTFPSPDAHSNHQGLSFIHLPDTVYDRGKTRANALEAKAVANAVMTHCKENPDLTLGVAAFSSSQRDAIEMSIELMRRKDPSNEAFFNSHSHEPFFVKNLENVQGDERDVILISIGYGKTQDGKLSMNFGPLNQTGGERRLNVLITRARLACRVFANFTADDLDLSRTDSRGVAALKTFLSYASSRALDREALIDSKESAPFETAVYDALKQSGYLLDSRIGESGVGLDLGLKDPDHPDRYLLGIESDGAAYDSARSSRDRDRLRKEVLESLGWRLHRIWSVDWFRNRSQELEKVKLAFEAAKSNKKKKQEIPPSQDEPAIPRSDESSQDQTPFEAAPYEEARISIILGDQKTHQLSNAQIAGYVKDMVQQEGPIHTDVIQRKILDAAGQKKASKQAKSAIQEGIDFAVEQNHVNRKADFLWPIDLTNPQVRDRSQLKGMLRKLQYISNEEIREALNKVIASALSIDRDDAASKAFALLGFSRLTPPAKEKIHQILDQMVEQGLIRENEGLLSVNKENNEEAH